jgi:hypothetical protein
MKEKKRFFRQKVDVDKLPGVLRFKWGDTVLDEGVVGVPKKMVRSLAELFPGADGIEQLQVALTLVDFRREGLKQLPTAAFLAFLAGLEEEKFLLRMRELESRGLVEFEMVRKAVKFGIDGLVKAIEDQSASKRLKELKRLQAELLQEQLEATKKPGP